MAETTVFRGAITSDAIWDVVIGNVPGAWSVNRFGAAYNGVQTTATDIWDRADATPTQQVWLAPTAARIHAIVSSDPADDGSPAGLGANVVRVHGLTAWDATGETTEDVTLNGVTPVNTTNSYVIIHRICVRAAGTSGPNVGTITATAAVDATVTAAIRPGNGQTEMAIYGIPSGKKGYITRWGCNIDRTVAATTTVDYHLMINEAPDTQPTIFVRRDDISLQTGSTTQFDRLYGNPYPIIGPAIIKVSAMASANDIDCESGFDLIVR